MNTNQNIFDSVFESLNAQQKEAVSHTGSPQVIIAGAGSGKTRVIMVKIAYFCHKLKTSPEKILAITFTNKAADELKERLESLNLSNVTACTFHSLCLNILRFHGEYAGLKKNIIVYDEQDQMSLIKECLSELKITDKTITPSYACEWISSKKDSLTNPSMDEYEQDGLEQLYQLYERKLLEQNAVDFGGIISNVVSLFRRYPSVVEHYKRKYTHILVDEYQDTNTAQAVFLGIIAEGNNNLCVVGDPDQSIYSWRGANIDNLLNFTSQFPCSKIFKLERNYRSTDIILKASNSVISRNILRYDKNLWSDKSGFNKIALYKVGSDRAEAYKTASLIEARVSSGLNYKDIAVFYRTHSLSRQIEEEFTNRGIPYAVIGGVPFYQRKEVKDILSFLRIIANPSDKLSYKRVINVPPRKIGDKTVAKIESFCNEQGVDFLTAMKSDELLKLVSKQVKEAFCFLVSFIEKYKSAFETSESWDNVVDSMIGDLGYINYLESSDVGVKSKVRIDNIYSLAGSIAQFKNDVKNAPIGHFLEKTSLRQAPDDFSGESDSVSLMTLHCAKGLEFKSVFIIGVDENIIPYYKGIHNPQEIEEERRLFYVGMTRAVDELCLFTSSSRFNYVGVYQSYPSRFLSDIPDEVIEENEIKQDYNNRHYYKDMEINGSDDRFNKAIDDFFVGDIVYHYDLGKGVILGGSGYGAKKKFIVMFDGDESPRVIMASYAGLTKLSQ